MIITASFNKILLSLPNVDEILGEPEEAKKREEINDLKMNEPKFKQQELLCRNGLDTKKCEIAFVYSHYF